MVRVVRGETSSRGRDEFIRLRSETQVEDSTLEWLERPNASPLAIGQTQLYSHPDQRPPQVQHGIQIKCAEELNLWLVTIG